MVGCPNLEGLSGSFRENDGVCEPSISPQKTWTRYTVLPPEVYWKLEERERRITNWALENEAVAPKVGAATVRVGCAHFALIFSL